jgi:hypothetical protein
MTWRLTIEVDLAVNPAADDLDRWAAEIVDVVQYGGLNAMGDRTYYSSPTVRFHEPVRLAVVR